jgi:2',3'-cyclic-nucleotide 2'-phosphodiesterase (5'-nucleotidase family)
MPFDNILVLQKMKGSELQQFLDRTTGREGWPMTGIEMDISEKKAVNIRVGNKPLDVNAIYTIANVDFLANGGENLDMLKAIPQINNGYLVRDAIFDYIKKFTQRNKPIGSKL